jgi:hypothetical protein
MPTARSALTAALYALTDRCVVVIAVAALADKSVARALARIRHVGLITETILIRVGIKRVLFVLVIVGGAGAVVVDSIADIGRTLDIGSVKQVPSREDVRVSVVTIAAVVRPEALRRRLAGNRSIPRSDPVAVKIRVPHGCGVRRRVVYEPIAVIVEAITQLTRSRTNLVVRVIAIAALKAPIVTGRFTIDRSTALWPTVPVAIGVARPRLKYQPVRVIYDTVAVVVLVVANLWLSRVDVVHGVVAV